MVKLKGPSVSAAASGAVADALVFSKTRKTAYLKKHSKPKNPQTPSQVSMRAMIAFLAQNWRNLSASDQNTWANAATPRHIAPYHAFVAANSKRWRNFLRPSKQDPATETFPRPASPGFLLTVNLQLVTLQAWPRDPTEIWGYSVHRSLATPFTHAYDNTVSFILQVGIGNSYGTDGPLDPGTYYYKVAPFGPTGIWGWWSATRTAVIT